MGRHRTPEEKRELGDRVREMRSTGRSRREIRAELGIGDELAEQLLSGTPIPEGLRRARAKDDLREQARQLRRKGATYDEISATLRVSKSSCSIWLRDLPHPESDEERARALQERRLAALRARAKRDRDVRDATALEVSRAAGEALGTITARDLVLALAVSYWCEGAKRKPWNRLQQVKWMNSDPVLVRLFLEGLALLGVDAERLVLRVHIHETADEQAARTWWAGCTGVPLDRFQRSTIKRHNPRTVRHNVGDEYRGCLCVTVLRSRELYQVLDGLVQGLAALPREVEGGTMPHRPRGQQDPGPPSALV